MNKNSIKTFAVWARNELITRVTQKAFEYGVEKNNIIDAKVNSINGKLLTDAEKKQRQQLIIEVNNKGFDQVIEEVAYTWFNRFVALRYMEVNNYLPNRIRIFTNEYNEFKPQILDEAMNVDLNGIDKELVFNLIESNNQEELYKQLIIATCNDMGNYLPGIFTRISDYKVLLFPDNILKKENVIGKMISDIEEDSWTQQVEVIGWLYQYYISERHNQVVNIQKGTVKKEDIPAATQLFTTDWVVRYMVDNSLGRYWIERNPNSSLKEKLEFLATSKEGTLNYVNDFKKPEELTFFDPCMGSGHILVYAFDVLMEIYRECGYSDRDAAISIVENNLYGIDIDERAYQLAYFAVMMKARSYNRRVLTQNIKNNLSSIIETNEIESLAYFGMKQTEEFESISNYLITTFKDALELGSLIEVQNKNFNLFENTLDLLKDSGDYTLDYVEWCNNTYLIAKKLLKQAKILAKKYVVTTTNPPYMGKMEGKLKQFVIANFKEFSCDLFSVFMKRNFDFTIKDGYLGFMTPFVWMFIKSYEPLREYIINEKDITTLVQMEYSAYEEATVPICSFVLKNKKSKSQGCYYRLSDFKGGMDIQRIKVLEANNNKKCNYYYENNINELKKIPGKPIAYWVPSKIVDKFLGDNIGKYAYSKAGIVTGDDNVFLRYWYEVDFSKVVLDCDTYSYSPSLRWVPMNKGGSYRKYYGNYDFIMDIYSLWTEGKTNKSVRRGDKSTYFKEGITWSMVTSGKASFRYSKNKVFGVAAPAIFFQRLEWSLLGYLNSKVVEYYNSFLNPTINILTGNIMSLPYVKENQHCNEIVIENVKLSKEDWDSFETSWDFKKHPFIRLSKDLWDITEINATKYYYYGKTVKASCPLELSFLLWQGECNKRFKKLKLNEEELNKIYINICGLQDELISELEDKDITLRKADLSRDIKSFISYAVGCMFGRYSLDVEGLAYAGGEWMDNNYKSFLPDEDNIIPICDDEYFEDDIINKFAKFVEVIYGKDTLELNLKFIADTLGGKGASRDVIRQYFLNDFFKDHCNTYQVIGSGKRPIYWLFDSGKKNGFKALVYIHRYTPDLIARMRTQYIHEQQARYRNQIELLENQIESDISISERVRLNKKLKTLKEQDEELRIYEEKIHHWADKMEQMNLDDGVKVNYAKFQELLAKIK